MISNPGQISSSSGAPLVICGVAKIIGYGQIVVVGDGVRNSKHRDLEFTELIIRARCDNSLLRGFNFFLPPSFGGIAERDLTKAEASSTGPLSSSDKRRRSFTDAKEYSIQPQLFLELQVYGKERFPIRSRCGSLANPCCQ
jgi:hypothetical protein